MHLGCDTGFPVRNVQASLAIRTRASEQHIPEKHSRATPPGATDSGRDRGFHSADKTESVVIYFELEFNPNSGLSD